MVKAKLFAERKQRSKDIAIERIAKLFDEASLAFKQNPELSSRYVELARKISSKYKVRMPSELKRRFCRHCGAYFVPSKTLKVRLKGQKVIYTCLVCGKFARLPNVREKKAMKREKAIKQKATAASGSKKA